jgi:hypothetical protein
MGHDKQTALDTDTQVSPHQQLDLEAEHDPARARNVSNAGLHHEEHKRVADAGTKDATKLHDTAHQASYDSLYTSIDLVAKRMHEEATHIKQIMKAPPDEGAGDQRQVEAIQHIYDGISMEVALLQSAMGSVNKQFGASTAYPIGKDLDLLRGGLNVFADAMRSAQQHYGKDRFQNISFTNIENNVNLMYASAGLEPDKSSPIDKDARTAPAVGDMEKAAIAANEASIHASVQAIKAKLGGSDDELRLEINKLAAAVQETSATLEGVDPARMKALIKKLPPVLKEAQAIVDELRKRESLRQYVDNTLWFTLARLHEKAKK